MKFTNKFLAVAFSTLMTISITGCSLGEYSLPYSLNTYSSNSAAEMADTFASSLCVVNSEISDPDITLSDSSCAGLFDLDNKETLLAVNVNKTVSPASLTKIMTALVALKYGSLDQELTATSNVYITESGAQKIGLNAGDTMTLDQALHLLLIYSANDVAMLIAEGIGGSVDAFIDLMNEEAVSIGATRSHFVNPHGLTADDHYVTTYDMYLIFNEAMKYDEFKQIISSSEYATQYTDKNGNFVDAEISNTNLYIRGDESSPSGITVIGGKTGTTNAAGHCLILLAKDKAGHPYISIIMKAEDNDTLYSEMYNLLKNISG